MSPRHSFACATCRRPARSYGGNLSHAGPACAAPRYARVLRWLGAEPMFATPGVAPRRQCGLEPADWANLFADDPLGELLRPRPVTIRPEDWEVE